MPWGHKGHSDAHGGTHDNGHQQDGHRERAEQAAQALRGDLLTHLRTPGGPLGPGGPAQAQRLRHGLQGPERPAAERSLRLLFLSDSVRVSDAQFAHLNTMLRDACHILDLEKVPPMYVAQDPQPNAMCIGLDEPIIVVTTGLVELLDGGGVRAVVGHEVGHALSGHAVYRTILLFLTNLALRVAWIPLGNIAIMTIVTALREWFRKSELSADRAGLLVGQDLKASMRGLMKLAGGNHLHEMNVDAFLEQAEEYEAGATCATPCSRSSTPSPAHTPSPPCAPPS